MSFEKGEKLDDGHALARLNAVFNGGQVGTGPLSLRSANPHRVETLVIVEMNNCIVGFASLRLVPCVFYDTLHADLTELFICPRSLPLSGYRVCIG